jgi:hypothetical protein
MLCFGLEHLHFDVGLISFCLYLCYCCFNSMGGAVRVMKIMHFGILIMLDDPILGPKHLVM